MLKRNIELVLYYSYCINFCHKVVLLDIANVNNDEDFSPLSARADESWPRYLRERGGN